MCSMKQPYTTSPILDHALAVVGTQRELAKQMGVTPSAVNQWRRNLPYKIALELAQRYGRRKPLSGQVAAWEQKIINQKEQR